MYITRSQSDSPEDFLRASLENGTGPFPDNPTRQEFKDDSDINFLIARYGVLTNNGRTPQYGEMDTDLDLQQAYQAVQVAENAFGDLPPQIRAKYGQWAALAQAIAFGETTLDAEIAALAAKPAETPKDPKGPESGSADPAGATPLPADKPKA